MRKRRIIRNESGRKVLRGFICLGTALLTVAMAAGQGGPAGQSSLEDLQHMVERGHAAEALAQLDLLAAKTPMPAGVQRLRGLALYAQNKLPEAEQAFTLASTQDPGDGQAKLMQGIVLFRLGRPAAAIPLLEAVRGTKTATDSAQQERAPVNPLYVLALCYVDTRRYDDARATFAAQFGFAPDSAAAYLLAARMLLRREYVPVAQQFAHKALELDAGIPLAHRLLGETELAGGHTEEAIRELELERKLNPLDANTYDRLGDAYTRQGKLPEAKASLQEAVLLDPNSTGPFIQLGKVLLKQGDAVAAAGYLERARSMDTQNFMTHSLLGQAYRQMGRTDDARRETEAAQRLQAATAPKLEQAH